MKSLTVFLNQGEKYKKNIYVFDSELFLYTYNLKTGFWVRNHLYNLCSSAVNSQRSLCSQKAVVKCSY